MLLPLAAGLIAIAGVDAGGFFVTFGLATLIAGFAFRLPMPVQPQKAVAAAAITEGWRASTVYGAALGMGVLWLALAATPLLSWVRQAVPAFVARGIQLALAFTLGAQALALLATSLPLAAMSGVLLLITFRYRVAGILLTCATAFLLMPKEALTGALSFSIPVLSLPTGADTIEGLVRGGIAQMPLTLTNAIIATVALTARYFPERAPTERQLAVSTGFMSLGGALLGAGPLCHGAGGLAAQYFYGARTVWKNVLEGTVAIGFGLFFASSISAALAVFPMPLLGALLLLVALELLSSAQGLYGWQGWIATATAVVGAVWNIGAAFVAGLIAAYLLREAVRRGWLPRLKGVTPAELIARIPQRLFPVRAA